MHLIVVLLASLSLPAALAGAAALGLATANGAFRVNGSAVSGNATLFEGALVETEDVPSRLQLYSGARMQLGRHARARIYRNRLVLEKGDGDMSVRAGFQLEARTLRISPAASTGTARVGVTAANAVQVAARKGSFRVYNRAGILVSNVALGDALEFEPQAGGAADSVFRGCLLKKDGKFILYDQTTSMVVELRGAVVEREWGNRVEVTGTAAPAVQPPSGAVQVLEVTKMTQIAPGGCLAVAENLRAEVPFMRPAGPPPAPPPEVRPKTGMSAGTKVAIVAAIAGGGAAGAVVATQKKSRSPQ